MSIGLPVFNGETYVEQAIRSILSQSHSDLELIISDNASTDRTAEVCRALAADEPRIRYFRCDQNEGAAANYNRVFEYARGEFFKWAAHDDVCRPEFIASCVRALDETPEAVLAYPRSRFIDAGGGDIGPDTDDMRVLGATSRKRLQRVLATVNMAGPVFGLIRSASLRKTRLVDSFVASDYVLIAELAILGPFVQVEEALFLRRLHERSSREANLTREEVLRWFDPRKRSSGRLTDRQRLALEYARSVRRLVPGALERTACLATIPSTMFARRIRVTGGRLRRSLFHTKASARAGSGR